MAPYKNADSPLWHDPTFRAKLRKKNQDDDFDWFMGQLRGMSTALGELYKLLPVLDGEVVTPYNV